jgi:hypothetical protein
MIHTGLTECEINDLLKRLALPFPPEDIEWRVGTKTQDGSRGLALPYITNRAVMERLDETVGPVNWRNTYEKGPDGGVLCGLAIRVQDEWITKYDGAANTDVEAVKGGLSDAMKRAAVQWGIGRYLYRLPSYWVPLKQTGKSHIIEEANYPKLPTWAMPEGYTAPMQAAIPAPKNGTGSATNPTSGVAPEATPSQLDAAMLDRAKAYLIPVGIPMAGKTLGEAMQDPGLGVYLVRWLAGETPNKAKEMFTPKNDSDKALASAAGYLIKHAGLPTAG